MDLLDFDLRIAKIKKAAENITDKEQEADEELSILLENAQYEIQKASELNLKEQSFFEDLFTMVLPDGLFQDPLREENTALYQSHKEQMVLAIKVIESEKAIDPDALSAEYTSQMKKSKQQTKIEISGSCESDSAIIYYFTAIHAMPDDGQCDFIILFKAEEKMVIMDFGFRQDEYSFWKTVIESLLPTICLRKGASINE